VDDAILDSAELQPGEKLSYHCCSPQHAWLCLSQ
jgi:hypothetical protein